MMKLSIVIPALNEEKAIGQTISRCLQVKPDILKYTQVNEVEIVVVSDGSTDRTVEIASGFEGISLIEFKKNRGYGAAIKAGWEKSGGELLAFLDADGTCDPKYFIEMCNISEKKNSDIVLGSRMGKRSQMPKTRRMGNLVFAVLLKLLSRKHLSDSASGMRVVKKRSLRYLYPLPDGLHFTPAMSARALLDRDLKIDEIEMDYKERIGQSKLHVVRDGLRFLKVILSTALFTKPSSLSFPIIFFLALIAAGLSLKPIMYYVGHLSFEKWMILRFHSVFLLGAISLILFSFTIISEHVISLGMLKYGPERKTLWWAPQTLRPYIVISSISLFLAMAVAWPGFMGLIKTGHIPDGALSWPRLIVASFFAVLFVQGILTGVVIQTINSLYSRQGYLIKDGDA
jgi:glycosyltransferase involved in cell wall biosynthesis